MDTTAQQLVWLRVKSDSMSKNNETKDLQISFKELLDNLNVYEAQQYKKRQ